MRASIIGMNTVFRPTFKKDTYQNILLVIFQYSCQIRKPAIFEQDDRVIYLKRKPCIELDESTSIQGFVLR